MFRRSLSFIITTIPGTASFFFLFLRAKNFPKDIVPLLFRAGKNGIISYRIKQLRSTFDVLRILTNKFTSLTRVTCITLDLATLLVLEISLIMFSIRTNRCSNIFQGEIFSFLIPIDVCHLGDDFGKRLSIERQR